MILSDPKGIPRTREEMKWAVDTGYIIPAFKDKDEITVEMLLDYVDLKLDWYTPSVNAIMFISFIRLCIGEEPENLNPKAHYFFVDCMFQSEEVKPYYQVRNMDFDTLKGNTLILSTREFSKSTILAYMILYMADQGEMPGFGKVNFGMYVSDRMDGNVKTTMRTIEDLYLGSKYLQSRFEWTHFTDSAIEMIRKPRTKQEIKAYNDHMSKKGAREDGVPGRMKRRFKVQGLGSSGGRGSRSGLDRPQFAIFDDMVANEKDAYSKAVLSAIDSTIEADVGSSLSGEGHFQILIGTAYHTGDPVYKRVTEGTFLPVVFPKAEVQPHGDIYDEKTGELIKPAMTKEQFVSVWPDRHTFEKQRKEYEIAERAAKKGNTKKLKTLDQEYYVRVTSEHERLIQDKHIKWIDMQKIKDNGQDYSWYITTDYTTTANKGSDLSGQFIWAVDWMDRWYLVDLVLEKQTIQEQYGSTFKFSKKAKGWGGYINEVAVEIDGQQVLHLSGLQRFYDDNKETLILARQKPKLNEKVTWDGIKSRGNGDKLWRLHLVAERFYEGKVFFNRALKYFNRGMAELIDELKMTTGTEIKANHDDGLDCISQMALIDILVPQMPVKEQTSYNGIVFDPVYSSNKITDYDCYKCDETRGYFN